MNWLKPKSSEHNFIIRSYLRENTRSHQNSEVKRVWAGLVLGLVTTWESPVAYVLFFVTGGNVLHRINKTGERNRTSRRGGATRIGPAPILQPSQVTSQSECMRYQYKERCNLKYSAKERTSVHSPSLPFPLSRSLIHNQVMGIIPFTPVNLTSEAE